MCKKIIILFLIVSLNGCVNCSISSSMLPRMEPGLSEEEANSILKKKGMLEFQFVSDGRIYSLESYQTKDTYKGYYFLYSEGELEAVIEKNRDNLCSECAQLPLSAESNGQDCLRSLLSRWQGENILQNSYNYSDINKKNKHEAQGSLAEMIIFSPLWLPFFPLFLFSQDSAREKVVSKAQSLEFGISPDEAFSQLGVPPEYMIFESNDFLMAGIPYKSMGYRMPAVALGFENGRLVWIDYFPSWSCSGSKCHVHGDFAFF